MKRERNINKMVEEDRSFAQSGVLTVNGFSENERAETLTLF